MNFHYFLLYFYCILLYHIVLFKITFISEFEFGYIQIDFIKKTVVIDTMMML